MFKIWVNHYGWIMGKRSGALAFTKGRAGAKPFAAESDELFNVRYFIENTMKCNYDLCKA